jgi:hemerythrin-like domain-containing protein
MLRRRGGIPPPRTEARLSENIFQRLRDDHARVLADLDDLERAVRARLAGGRTEGAGDPLERARALVAMLERQFATHMAAEDDVMFPAIARQLEHGPALVAPLHEEHDELKLMLEALAATLARPDGAARDEQILVQVRDLSDLLRIHIRKEETLVFGVAERLLDAHELARLAALRSPGRSSSDSGPHSKGNSA